MNYLTVAETAERLHLCTKTIYKLCNSGELEHYRAGRAVRIPDNAIPMTPQKSQKLRPIFGFQHF